MSAWRGGEGAGGGDGPQQRRSLPDPGERRSQEEDGLHAHECLLQVMLIPDLPAPAPTQCWLDP